MNMICEFFQVFDRNVWPLIEMFDLRGKGLQYANA